MAGGQRTVKIRFTGDTKDLDRAANAAERSLGGFRNTVIKAMGSLKAAGEKGAGLLVSGLEGGLKTPYAGAAIATALAIAIGAAAPVVGAAITSAILLGVGGGVLAAGIKAAASDPRVKAAFGGLKKTAESAFKEFGKPFVEPLVRASKLFQTTIDQTVSPALNRMGAMMAPLIDKLAPKLDQFFKAVLPGIEKAVAASMPLFETLADELPKIGEAIGDFFSIISSEGDSANVFFGDLLTLVKGLIRIFGGLIAVLSDWYGKLRGFLTKAQEYFLIFRNSVIRYLGQLLDGAVKALGWIPGMGPKLKKAQDDFRQFQVEANKELRKVKDRNVRISVTTNVGAAVGATLRGLASLPVVRKAAGRASGGSVMAGRSYMVGEKGPELVTFGRNGYVTPNHQLGGGPQVLELTLNLGHGIREVISIDLKEHDRQLKRAVG